MQYMYMSDWRRERKCKKRLREVNIKWARGGRDLGDGRITAVNYGSVGMLLFYSYYVRLFRMFAPYADSILEYCPTHTYYYYAITQQWSHTPTVPT